MMAADLMSDTGIPYDTKCPRSVGACITACPLGISRVCSTLAGGVLAISVVVMGNGAVTTGYNYEHSGQVVSRFNEKTNIYTSFTRKPGITLNIPGYSSDKNMISGVGKVTINDEKLENLKKIEMISMLQDNWNGNGAKAFTAGLISKARNIITYLDIQPEVFPTACESLQLEYDKQDGSHMEIELTEGESAEVFVVDSMGCETIRDIQAGIKAINKVVNDFYG